MVDRRTGRHRLRGGAAITAALLGLVMVVLQAGPAQAASAQAAPATRGGGFTLPDGAPTPGADFEVKAAYKVIVGFQIYTCVTSADGTVGWSTPTSVPEAVLKAYGSWRLIHHFGGPSWRALDGSTVVAAPTVRQPREGTIPWLLLEVTAHETSQAGDELHDVTHISRVNTRGGVGPSGACTLGDTKWVSYGADYVFWAPTTS